MREVARMYYVEERTRQEISAELGLDPRKVTWLLDQAKELGVVRITILGPPQEELAAQIKIKYPHLQRVLIAPGEDIKTGKRQSVDEVTRQVDKLFERFAVLASDYFEAMFDRHPVGKQFHLGVTGGHRLLQFANAVPARPRKNLFVHAVALIGRGPLAKSSHVEPSVVASLLWTRSGSFDGKCEYQTVEPYQLDGMSQQEAREAIKKELGRLKQIPSIHKVIDDLNDLDAVFAGFGFPSEPQLEARMGMTGSLLESVTTAQQLAEEGVVGDFCYCPYDADGQSSDRWRFFLTAGDYSKYPGIEFYKNMVANGKKVVAFGGPSLLPVIKAALKAKIVNVLIIDEHTAQQLAKGR
jgi:deoxyribonucleoside regulator